MKVLYKLALIAFTVSLTLLTLSSCSRTSSVRAISISEIDLNKFDRVYFRGWDNVALTKIQVPNNFEGIIKVHFYNSKSLLSVELDDDSYEDLTLELRVLNATDQANSIDEIDRELSVIRFEIRSKNHTYSFDDTILDHSEIESIRTSGGSRSRAGYQSVLGYVTKTPESSEYDIDTVFDSIKNDALPNNLSMIERYSGYKIFWAWIEVIE
jgi:hypothetical protein